VESEGISDHLPIYFEIRGGIDKPKGPFKFNSSWLKNASYPCMVTDFWKSHPPNARGHIAEGFSHNLKEQKRLSKMWAHNKRVQDDQTLRDTEAEIVVYENNQGGVFTSIEQKEKLTSIYSKRYKILKDREEPWILRSREIWLLEGDDNMKFYHKFANIQKAITQLMNEQRDTVNTFPHLASLASSHFK